MADQVQILIAEKSRSLAQLLVKVLEEANFKVGVARSVEEALAMVKEARPELVISSASRFDGELLCKQLKRADRALPVALLYPASRTADCEERGRLLGADLVLLGPVQAGPLRSAARLLIRMGRLVSQAAEQERTPAPKPMSPSAKALAPIDAQAPDMASFKKILDLEVKKSRRYKVPAAFALVQLDEASLQGRSLDRASRSRVIGAVLAEITTCLRDVDMCVLAGDDRYLVFLPHTPLEGARSVATRILDRVDKLEEPKVSVSLGVAAYDGQGGPVSFGALLREATLALKRARSAGGHRVDIAAAKKGERVVMA